MTLQSLFERKLLENQQRRVVGLFPGRFQPFHKGHKQVYEELKQWTGDLTYILTSNDTSSYKSPLEFEDKKTIITRMGGVPGDHVLQVERPYSVPTTLGLDEYNTIAVFAVSAKDMQGEPRFQFPDDGSSALRQDGAPKYMQAYPGSLDKCEPMVAHAYVMTVDVHEFQVGGQTITSATELRAMLIGDEAKARQCFEDMYGRFDEEVFKLLRERITTRALTIESSK